MARGYVTGLLWGVIVVGGGLAVLSQLAPPAPDGKAVEIAGEPAATPAVAPAKDTVATSQTLEPAVADTPASAALQPGPTIADAPKGMRADVVESGVAPAGSDAIAVARLPALVTAETAVEAKPAKDAVPEVAQRETVAPADETMAETAPVVDVAAIAGAPGQPAVSDARPPQTVAAEGAPVTPVVPALPKAPAAEAQLAADIKIAEAEPPQPEIPVQDVGDGVVPGANLPLPDLPAAPEAPPTLAGLEPALTAPGAEAGPQAGDPLPPEPEGAKDTLLVPSLPPGQAEPARLPQIAEPEDPVMAEALLPAPPVPEAELPPQASQATTIQAQQPTLPPVKGLTDKVPTGLGNDVPGVEVNTLPQIGAAPKADVVALPSDTRPVVEYARTFEPVAGKPLFVILLHDVGAAGMSREDLAKLPFPVSFVVDPLASDAKAAQAAYRAAGQEVLVLANGIPPGAEAGDLAETFQTLSGILPESVAVIDQDLGGFQDNRPLATMVLPILQDEGRGLVTYDRGLNAADQIARRDGVPSAVIFRRLDGEGETKATIRRYLDRAAFKAAQEGQVVVIGDTRADTVAAILEWTLEGKGASVTLAPVTAVLGR